MSSPFTSVEMPVRRWGPQQMGRQRTVTESLIRIFSSTRGMMVTVALLMVLWVIVFVVFFDLSGSPPVVDDHPPPKLFRPPSSSSQPHSPPTSSKTSPPTPPLPPTPLTVPSPPEEASPILSSPTEVPPSSATHSLTPSLFPNSLPPQSPMVPQDPVTLKRQQAVKDAFIHAWEGYVRCAWGFDEVKPLKCTGVKNWGGLGATIVDSIDTMIIMDYEKGYLRAKEWVESLDFNVDYGASTFETTIRFIGGLNSAYDLTGEKIFLEKSVELADRLLPAFNTNTGIPYSTVNLKSGKAWSPSWNAGASFLAEFGTLQLEFKYLSRHSRNPIYAQVVNTVMDKMFAVDTTPWHGLFPQSYHAVRGTFTDSLLKFGARGDSFYEYLLKQYLQTNKTDTKMYEVYKKAMNGMKELLLVETEPNHLTYVVEMDHDRYIQEMDHLVCFLGGVLALDGIPEHLPIAEALTYTCWQFYERSKTGLGPEIAGFGKKAKNDFTFQAPHYILRPETVESLFILYRVTGDQKYREWGWKIFLAIEKHCRTDIAYSGVRNVDVEHPQKDNRMESFFMAETLKYLYLLFSPNELIPLDEFVFNTEAHPTRIWNP
eukprot:TRINITY_DN1230_c0_g1_i1.p1 TRINITY_DN1230_c0_g1~~TRINITY_DN1230_c0_g1_i1.p1  ORF type:complete len:599 (-),score=119.11 TRINITY_DN1230_c0_g1_i1:208-2004(-)